LWNSDEPDDWDRAFADYFDRLESKSPDTSHREEIESLRGQLEERKAIYRAEQNAKRLPVGGEAQWFVQEGLRSRQRGDDHTARRLFENVVQAFGSVKSEQMWVDLAKKELLQPNDRVPTGDQRWKPARESLAHARELRDQGKRQEADAIWKGLEELYANDKSATPILDEVKRDRGG
jgi:hypothetical protein